MISTHIRNNVIGVVALFVALGGVGYAAGTKPNSVKSKSIKDGQVKTADLGVAAVDTSKLADGSVTTTKLAPDSVTGAKVEAGSLTGSDLGANSISGAEVDEGTLDIAETALDPSVVQRRVGTGCLPGESIRAIAQDGAVTCQGGGGVPSGAAGGDLSGTYPNPQIAANAIGSPEIANDAVGTSEIGVDAVGTSEIDDGSVLSGDVALDTLGTADIGTAGVGLSELGPDAVGESELGGTLVNRVNTTVDGLSVAEVTVTCPAGSQFIGGGGQSAVSVANVDIHLLGSAPSASNGDPVADGDPPTAWTAKYFNQGGIAEGANTYAICLA